MQTVSNERFKVYSNTCNLSHDSWLSIALQLQVWCYNSHCTQQLRPDLKHLPIGSLHHFPIRDRCRGTGNANTRVLRVRTIYVYISNLAWWRAHAHWVAPLTQWAEKVRQLLLLIDTCIDQCVIGRDFINCSLCVIYQSGWTGTGLVRANITREIVWWKLWRHWSVHWRKSRVSENANLNHSLNGQLDTAWDHPIPLSCKHNRRITMTSQGSLSTTDKPGQAVRMYVYWL